MSGPSHRIPVYYDFASTLSYVAHRVLGRLGDRLEAAGINLVWRPLDLTMIAPWRRGAVHDEQVRRRVKAIARPLVGDVHVPPVWLDSRRPAAVTLALSGTVHEPAWRERVWTAIYEERDDPGAPGAVARWGRDLDVDVDGLARQEADETLVRATRAARAVGVAAVPTLLLGEWPMAGIQDDATMLALLTRFVARRP